MKKTLFVSLASSALFIFAGAALADHAPVKNAATTPYASSQHPASTTKAVGLKPVASHRSYATDIVVLNYTSSPYEVEVDHPPVIDDVVAPNGYDRITNSRWYGLTDLHIYYYGMKVFDDVVGNHAIVSIYPDGVDVDNNSF
ncbi:MAG: hypothetical protein P4M14_09435 [Gammaproteobacteria bacterium]|nr:hypothetical protein [Gammaproteobacteria bacterium]